MVPLQDEERQAWATLPFNEKQYRKDFGIPKLFGETDYTTLERTWARPTLEVNGLLSGFTGEGAKTVLPAVAMAKISMRLVPNQDPDKIAELFEAYVQEARAEDGGAEGHAHARRQAVDDVVRQPVRAGRRPRDRTAASASKPVFTREGGSIPVVSTFQEELGLPSVLFGVGLPDENAHAPNEKLDVGNFHGGIIASAILYDEIANRRSECDAGYDTADRDLATRQCPLSRPPMSRSSRTYMSMLDDTILRERFYGVLPPPPRDPFTLFVWEVLSVHSTPRKRDAALAALKRIPALTPDAMWRAPQKKLEESVALAGPVLREPAAGAAHRRATCSGGSPKLPKIDPRAAAGGAARAASRCRRSARPARTACCCSPPTTPILPVDARVSRVGRRLGYGEAAEDFKQAGAIGPGRDDRELPPSADAYRHAFLYLSHHGGATCTESRPALRRLPAAEGLSGGQRSDSADSDGMSEGGRDPESDI